MPPPPALWFTLSAFGLMPSRHNRSRKFPARLVVAVLASGALAFACGPRSHSEAAASASLATVAAPVTLAGLPRSQNTPVLGAAFAVKIRDAGVDFVFDVVNRSKKNVEVTFPNGQTHEFVVVDSIGREVWRWSENRLFTQNVQNRLLSGGEAMRVGERWERPGVHGRYTAVARLRSSNFPIEQRTEIVIP